MAIIDTSNIVDSAMLMKAKLPINLSMENHYIEDLQAKRSADFYYRYNVITLEEEKNKNVEYTDIRPYYTPIEAVIQTVKDDKGKELSDDWRRLSFEKMDCERRLGKRYRFGYEFEKFPSMTEDEKEYNSSIWLTINMNTSSSSADVVVRRCNSNVILVGSDTMEYGNIIETHKEPIILESNIQYTSYYKSLVLDTVSGDAYLIAQLNYFTNFIKVNDRLIIGNTSSFKENNNLYKVKNLNKFNSVSTFRVGYDSNLEYVPIIVASLEKDVIMGGDDFPNRVAERSPMYKVQKTKEISNTYELKYMGDIPNSISLGNKKTYNVQLYNGIVSYDADINIAIQLVNSDGSRYLGDDFEYYEFKKLDNNHFYIKNCKQFKNGHLQVVASTITPLNTEVSLISEIELRGFY